LQRLQRLLSLLHLPFMLLHAIVCRSCGLLLLQELLLLL
jgi:hypothetical protein